MAGDRRSKLGKFGERLAQGYLLKEGYHIRELNFRCPIGEIDIVAEKDGELVFVEVRTRRGTRFGTPEESITSSKMEKLIDVANAYRQSNTELPHDWRIDVVAIELSQKGQVTRIELIENAISQEKDGA